MLCSHPIKSRMPFGMFQKRRTNRQFLRIIQTVIRPCIWRVRFKRTAHQQPGLIGIFSNKPIRFLRDKRPDLLFRWQTCAISCRKLFQVRCQMRGWFNALRHQPLIVGTHRRILNRIQMPQIILNTDPLIKPMLANGIVAQMPFAHICLAICIWHHFRNRLCIFP